MYRRINVLYKYKHSLMRLSLINYYKINSYEKIIDIIINTCCSIFRFL